MKLSPIKRPLMLALAGCLAIAFVDGCSCSEEPQAPTQAAKSTPPPPTPAAKPLPDAPLPTLRESLEKKAALVASYPEDAPVYEWANLSNSALTSGKATAVFSGTRSVAETVEWTREFLSGQGWQANPNIDIDGGTLLTAVKDGRELSVLVSQVESDGAITMIVVAVHP